MVSFLQHLLVGNLEYSLHFKRQCGSHQYSTFKLSSEYTMCGLVSFCFSNKQAQILLTYNNEYLLLTSLWFACGSAVALLGFAPGSRSVQCVSQTRSLKKQQWLLGPALLFLGDPSAKETKDEMPWRATAPGQCATAAHTPQLEQVTKSVGRRLLCSWGKGKKKAIS